jgi:HPt (histidine-containing phosphotransfer) domain-containing protein
MDFRTLAKDLGMEEDEFSELVNLFLNTSYSDLSKLQTALRVGDFKMAADAAHSIKGAAMSLGLLEIYEFAKSMEISARENHLDKVNEMAKKTKEEIDQIGETITLPPHPPSPLPSPKRFVQAGHWGEGKVGTTRNRGEGRFQ